MSSTKSSSSSMVRGGSKASRLVLGAIIALCLIPGAFALTQSIVYAAEGSTILTLSTENTTYAPDSVFDVTVTITGPSAVAAQGTVTYDNTKFALQSITKGSGLAGTDLSFDYSLTDGKFSFFGNTASASEGIVAAVYSFKALAEVEAAEFSLTDVASAASGSIAEEEAIAGETKTIEIVESNKEYKWYGDGTATAYTIANAAELVAFAHIVNGTVPTEVGIAQDSFKGKTVTLSADIDLASVCGTELGSWEPIGNATYKYNANAQSTGYLVKTGNVFLGTFDGAGKTISNLYISSAKGYLGLFGNIGGTDEAGKAGYGTVKNFTLTGSVTCTNTTAQGTDYVAGVVALLNPGGTICDVINKASVTAKNSMNVGGIVGFAGTGYDLGGAGNMNVAKANPSGENTYVLRCGNEGDIVGYYKAGGIVGENAAIIMYCYNTGTISQAMSGSGGGIGGIAGRNGNRDNADNCEAGTIMYCYNAGTIKGTSPVSGSTIRGFGGITGWNNIISKVQHNYAAGVVEVGYSDYQAVVGRVDNGTGIADNYALNTLADKYNSTEVDKLKAGIKKTEAEFKVQTYNDGDILTLLGVYFVADTNNINNGYPILWWQKADATLPTLQSIAITSAPTKVVYTAGQTFDTAGLVLMGTYSDGSKHAIAVEECTYNTDTLTTEDTSITFTYKVDQTTLTAVQTITVNPAVLSAVTVKTQPSYTVYAANEPFDKTGLVVNASYNDGEVVKTLADDDYTVTEDRANNKVVVSYTDGGVTQTVDIAITFVKCNAIEAVEGIYEIASADELIWFAAQVNQHGNTTINAKLTANIDLSGIALTSIGTSKASFNATFDGNNKTITYSAETTFTNTTYQGVIGYLDANGVVKNLTTAGAVTLTGSNSSPLVAYVKAAGAKILNCTNNAVVTATAGTIGGILGNAYYACTISDCTNAGAITGTSSNVGGIVGSSNNDAVSIANCANNAAITGTTNVGGIVGTGKAGIDSCINTGAISATTAATGVAGGIIGNATSTSLTAGNVVKCVNMGTVTGGKAGGIVGSTYMTAYTDCYNTGAVNGTGTGATAAGSGGLLGCYTLNKAGATFTNCYSTGTVSGTVNANALIGYDTKGATLVNCYYIKDAAAAVWGGTKASTTGFAEKSATDMKSAEFVAALGESFKADLPGFEALNGGFPILTWQKLSFTYTKGDVSFNGKINIVDAQVIYDMANGVWTSDPTAQVYDLLLAQLTNVSLQKLQCTADVNGDGIIDATDARAVQYYVHNGSFVPAE